jgi:hypothetical protein
MHKPRKENPPIEGDGPAESTSYSEREKTIASNAGLVSSTIPRKNPFWQGKSQAEKRPGRTQKSKNLVGKIPEGTTNCVTPRRQDSSTLSRR